MFEWEETSEIKSKIIPGSKNKFWLKWKIKTEGVEKCTNTQVVIWTFQPDYMASPQEDIKDLFSLMFIM